MVYGIMRTQKYKASAVTGIGNHDFRKKESKTNPDIDPSRTHLNYNLIPAPVISLYNTVKNKIAELNLTKSIRKDAVYMVGVLFTASPDYFLSISEERQRNYFEDCLQFVKDKFGEKNIVSAVVHLDESTPHLHVNFVPITNDNRLCAKELLPDLGMLQDEYYKKVSQGYGLERGEIRDKSKPKTKRHLSTQEYKALQIENGIIKGETNSMRIEYGVLQDEMSGLRDDVLNARMELEIVNGVINKLKNEEKSLQRKISDIKVTMTGMLKDCYDELMVRWHKLMDSSEGSASIKPPVIKNICDVDENKGLLEKLDELGVSSDKDPNLPNTSNNTQQISQ